MLNIFQGEKCNVVQPACFNYICSLVLYASKYLNLHLHLKKWFDTDSRSVCGWKILSKTTPTIFRSSEMEIVKSVAMH